MNILSSFNEIIDNAKSAFLRFPITIIWAIIGTAYTIWFIESGINGTDEFSYVKIIISSILGISWLIGTRLLIEYFKEEKGKNISWLMIVPIVLLGLYYFTLPDDKVDFESLVIPYRFTLFLIAGHLFVFFSSFLMSWDKNAYWNYLKNIFISFITSAIFSLVLYLGLVMALLSMKYLFHIHIDGDIFAELFIFCLGIVNTWIFVAEINKNIHHQKDIDYPRALLVMVKYILIPLTILYLVILYAYSAKIIIRWDLPKGWVSYLVVALSILGFVIHILINPIRKTIDSVVIKKFYPWFYYALLPMIVLLFVAIYKRISEYGITENRYLILLLAFWILGMTIYLLVGKRKQLRYFPMSVAILALLVSFGFWGIFSVSKLSQIHEFTEVYNKIESNSFQVTNADRTRIESIAYYLKKRGILHKVSNVIGYNPMEVFDADNWDIVNRMCDSLNMTIIDIDESQGRRGTNFFNSKYNEVIDISGYNYMRQIYFDSYDRGPKIVQPPHGVADINMIKDYNITLDTISSRSILVLKDNVILHSIDLVELVDSLKSSNTIPNRYRGSREYDQESMTLEHDYEDMKIKIVFQDIEIRTQKDKKVIPMEIVRASARVMINIKDDK